MKKDIWDTDTMITSIKRYAMGPKPQNLTNVVTRKCQVCCANNLKNTKKATSWKGGKSNYPRGILANRFF